MRTTFSQFLIAFRSAKGQGNWRLRTVIGAVALDRVVESAPTSADYADLVAALDDVVGGRSFSDPDAVALRAVFPAGRA